MRNIGLGIFIVLSSFATGCAPSTTPGRWVDIPSIFFYCPTTNCRQNANPSAYAELTTSGCTNPAPGRQRTATIVASCTAGVGCTGTLLPWLYTDGRTTTGIPNGDYSLCIRVDYNGDYPASTTGDSFVASSIRINWESQSSIIQTDWVDQ